MVAQALTELPNECCGLVLGNSVQETPPSQPGQIRTAVEYFPLENAAASAVEFLSEPKSMFRAARRMREMNLEILAVLHSHPTSDPIPSGTDLERNYSEEVMNLIISLKPPAPILRAWWLKPHEFEEGQWGFAEDNYP
jgi:proteasome lid subunit RPN8/RPN11